MLIKIGSDGYSDKHTHTQNIMKPGNNIPKRKCDNTIKKKYNTIGIITKSNWKS